MATVTVDAAKVAAAAKDVIAHCMHIRNLRNEATIAKVMKVERKTWWKPWKKTFTLNREEAIALLDKRVAEGWIGAWHSTYRYAEMERAKSLLLMAQYGDPVVLDEGAICVLFGDWRKEK